MSDDNAELPHICECCRARFDTDAIADISEGLRLEYTLCATCIRLGIEHFASQIEDYLLELGKREI